MSNLGPSTYPDKESTFFEMKEEKHDIEQPLAPPPNPPMSVPEARPPAYVAAPVAPPAGAGVPTPGGRGRGRGRGLPGGAYSTEPAHRMPTKIPIGKDRAIDLKRPYFIIGVSIAEIVIFIFEIIANGGFESMSINPMLGPSADTLMRFGAKYGPKIITCKQWWRLFLPMFVHVGVIHLLMNVATQLAIGWSLEKKYGFWRIIPIYLLSGVFGNILSTIFLPQTISCGSSSSIFGFVGVLFIDIFQNWKVLRNPICNLVSLLVTTVISLLLGLLPFIDNFAHIGGFIEGLICALIFLPNMYFWSKSGRRSKKIALIVAIPLCLLSIIGGCIILFKSVNVNGWCKGCKYLSCVPIKKSWCDDPVVENSTSTLCG